MKNFIILVMSSILINSGCAASAQNPEKENGGKTLLVYFSRTGHNYPDPYGVPLKVGNTARTAAIIADITGADMFEIIPVDLYPDDYDRTVTQATVEKNSNARPAIKNRLDGIEHYDTIILGYPIWCGTTPMIVRTFLDTYDLSGKTVVPFSTHHGSGLGTSVGDLRRALPESTVTEGLAVWDNRIDSSKSDIEQWLTRSGVIR